MAEVSADTLMEEREALMISPTGGSPTLRTAHFLTPTLNSIKPLPSSPLHSTKPTISELKNTQLKVHFNGRKYPQRNWKTWVHQLKPRFELIWKKSGIYEAILASTYQTLRHNDLIIELADRWCAETNTFIFPWGEATITLEDMMVLGGYSVLGESVLSPLKTNDLFEIKENLSKALRDIRLSCGHPYDNVWMEHFMGNGALIEHEAFLCLWLSRYVLPMNRDYMKSNVFPIAIYLSRGTKVALAPAVLASIYRDLSLLKKSMIGLTKLGVSEVILSAPFQLVQLWAWERFPTLGPVPNAIKCGEPRSARWHSLRKLKVEDVGKAIDFAGECFQWRPYATVLNNWAFCKFYKENEEWVFVESDVNKEVELFARCLRVSELVGLDCIEQYLPHRVAMQFGFDQDIPCWVSRSNETLEIAWNNYDRPFRDDKLYMPPRLFESDVTLRYLDWWKDSVLGRENAIEGIARKKRSKINRVRVPRSFTFDHNRVEAVDYDEEDRLTIAEMLGRKSRSNSTGDRLVGDDEPLMNKKNDRLLVPPGFPSKRFSVVAVDNLEEDKLTIGEMWSRKSKSNIVGERLAGDEEPMLINRSQCSSSSAPDGAAVRSMEFLMKHAEMSLQSKAFRSREDADASKTKCLFESISHNEGKGGKSDILQMLALKLEARVSKLERVILG